MSEKDFDLDIKVTSSEKNEEVNVTSKSLCTPGCPTGILQTCPVQSTTCGCTTFTCP